MDWQRYFDRAVEIHRRHYCCMSDHDREVMDSAASLSILLSVVAIAEVDYENLRAECHKYAEKEPTT